MESVQRAPSCRAHSHPLASHAMTRRHGDAGRLNGLMEGAGDLRKSGSIVALLAASSRAASWPSSPCSHCIGLLHEAVRCSAWPKMSCSTGNSYIFTDIICSMLCTSSSNASSLLTCLPQLGSTDGVDCAVKTEVRGCASDKPHSVYFRNVQNLDTVISYRHITILFVIFVVSSTKFFLFILI